MQANSADTPPLPTDLCHLAALPGIEFGAGAEPSRCSVSDRLPPVSPEDFLNRDFLKLAPPTWLTRLESTPRSHLRCLPSLTRASKRIVDIVSAIALLVVGAPIVILAAVAIKLTSPGPVFFTQMRVGLNSRYYHRRQRESTNCRRKEANYGRPFTIYKLRTMTVESSKAGPSQAASGDRRVTAVGRFLRQMRIDELPQLVNILKGEMSMVGPRPECIEYIEELSRKVPCYLDRLGLKPGLTGIAQIEAGYANNLESYRRKVALDRVYLENCCLWNDIKVMFRTIGVVFTGFGAL